MIDISQFTSLFMSFFLNWYNETTKTAVFWFLCVAKCIHWPCEKTPIFLTNQGEMLMEQSLSLYVDFLVIWIYVHFCSYISVKNDFITAFFGWERNMGHHPVCAVLLYSYIYVCIFCIYVFKYPYLSFFLCKNCVQSIRLGGSEVATLQLYLQQQHQNLQQQLQNLLMFQVFT